MKKFWKITIIIILITAPLVYLLFHIDSQQKQEDEEISVSTTIEEKQRAPIDFDNLPLYEEICEDCGILEESKIESTQTLKQTAWIPPWDYKNGLESLARFESDFHSISPVTFQINSNGTIKERLDPHLTDLKKITDEKNIKLIPTISNFDSNIMQSILESPENTQRHIDSILKAVLDYEYDGIDLDYESIKKINKEQFLNFLEELSKRLKDEDKIFSVTVLPKWGEGVVYTGLVETREVQDWEIISKWADEVRIMAYDFTPVPSSQEGPIAPISWVEKILEYAKTKIPKEKIWLGVHLYSYEWVMPTIDSGNTRVRTNSYTYKVVKEKILSHSYVKAEYDKEYEEGYAEYSCLNNYFCILFYATPESVKARENLAKSHNIAGLAYWRLGGEDELIK